jgi:two-component system, chemotaxis family, chemotaxis protein CheY
MIGKRATMLTVDNFPTPRRILRILLRQLGYTNIVEAEDSEAALTRLKRERIDVVLLDWNMSEPNGCEILKAIRADEDLYNTPLVMLVVDHQKQGALAAATTEVDGFIITPLTAEALEAKLRQVLDKKVT